MALKYKVGDRVKIKSLDWYNENKDENGNIYCGGGLILNLYNAELFCGRILTIRQVCSDFYTVIENLSYWNDYMIEGLVEEIKPKFKIGDKITNGKGKFTILQITSDKYIVGDNFGECGTVYFNSQDYWKLMEHDFIDIDEFQDDNEVIDIIDEYVHCFKGNECQIDLPEGYQFTDEDGNVINATKIILEKKNCKFNKVVDWLRKCNMTKYISVLYSGACSISFNTEDLIKDLLKSAKDDE